MIVIGADIHKRSHALAAVDAGTGAMAGELGIAADDDGHRRAVRWARSLDGERVWALEDCRGISGRLERALVWRRGARGARPTQDDGRVAAR